MAHDVSVPCPVCQMPRSFHGECLASAVAWVIHQQYDSTHDPDLARRLAPTCYLCGTRKTEHAEHVTPRNRGGGDLWSNIGGACAPCNQAKGYALPTLTAEQQARLGQHQHQYRAAWSRSTADVVTTELTRRVRQSTTLEPGDPLDWLAEAVGDELGTWTEQPFTTTVNGDHVVAEFTSVRLAFFPSL